MKKRLTMMLCAILVSLTAALAQTRISGVVLQAEDGEPVVGATVKVKATNRGTLTDAEGRFSLNAKPGETLTFSMAGMTPTEARAKNGMRVLLEGTTELNEVLVMAYGTTTKAKFTGSAKTIDNSTIEQVQSSNALDALSGHVAGVEIMNPTGDPTNQFPTIRLRGITSINAGTDPLIIMDGTPYSGDMNTINNADIESLTVLKDAAANALYGSRGANGVIVITTKKAKAGNGAKVKLDAKWGSNSRARRDYKTIDNTAQYYETYYQALNNYAKNSLGYNDVQANAWANQNLTANNGYGLAYNVYTIPDGQSMIGMNGKLNPNATYGNVISYNGQEYLLQGDDWLDEIYHNGLRQEYNVSVTNATDRSNFLASVGYLDNQGIVDNSSFTRINGRLKADLQVRPWLKVGANLGYSHYTAEGMEDESSSNSSGNLFALASQVGPIYQLYLRDANGNKITDANGYTMYDYGSSASESGVGLDRPVLSSSNAVQANLLDENSWEGNAMNASGFAEVKIANDFKISSTNTVNVDEARYTWYTNPYYGQYASSNGMLTKEHTRQFSYDFQQLVNWGHVYGNHDIDVMVGHESFWNRNYYLYGSRNGMFSTDNHELNGAVVNGTPGSYQTSYNNEGYFMRAQYNYAGKYFLSASYRRDASSRFHPDHRWGNFGSAGGAWVLSQEDFMKKAKWVNFLKAKISYGEQGNDNISDYLYTNTYTISNSNGSPAATPETMGNEEISWEKNANLNAGVEFSFFKDRLNGSVEYFWRKTSDMLFWFSLPVSMGYTGYWKNIGDMKNQGLEIDLTGTIIKTRNVRWDVSANLTHYRNKITKLADEVKTTTSYDGTEGYTSGYYFIGEGRALYSYYLPEYAGVYSESTYQTTGSDTYDESLAGHSMWYTNTYDSEGNITGRQTTTDYSSADDYIVGKKVPTVYGGFSTRLEFFGFDFAADFTYSLGGDVLDLDYATFMGSPSSSSGRGYAIHQDILKSWTTDNSDSNIPRYQYGSSEYAGGSSSRYLTSANYLSLQNLTLGYTLPSRITRKATIDQLRLYVSCSNVWLWTARRGMDPRTALLTSSYTNSSRYSQVRTISVGVNVTF